MLRLVGMGAPLHDFAVSFYTIPTADQHESDGTLAWSRTTIVIVEAAAAGKRGLGYTYADRATALTIRDLFVPLLTGHDALDVGKCWELMVRAIRNLGRPGIDSMAIAAVDSCLWDLKAKILGLPLASLLGRVHDSIACYGSGGFTSYSIEQLQRQLGGWAAAGISKVKMKVGRKPDEDVERVRAARNAIGLRVGLFVDANGSYTRKQALAMAGQFALEGVSWLEEPVPSDDLEGLRLVRDRAPAGMDIAAGEYGYDLVSFRRLLEAGGVDVLQADATRCAGITGFLRVGALCDAFGLPLSAHTAPSLHTPLCCALSRAIHVEYFFDHARIEQAFFDGAARPVDGRLAPDLTRPGLGLELKRADIERFAA